MQEFGFAPEEISMYSTGTTEVVRIENKTHIWRGYVIWVEDWKYLAHEIFHCAYFILRDKGMCLSDDSNEAYAYLIEYLDTQFRKG